MNAQLYISRAYSFICSVMCFTFIQFHHEKCLISMVIKFFCVMIIYFLVRGFWWSWFAVSLLHLGLELSSIMGHGLASDQNRYLGFGISFCKCIFIFPFFKIVEHHSQCCIVFLSFPDWAGFCGQPHFHDWFRNPGANDCLCCYHAKTSWVGWWVHLLCKIFEKWRFRF